MEINNKWTTIFLLYSEQKSHNVGEFISVAQDNSVTIDFAQLRQRTEIESLLKLFYDIVHATVSEEMELFVIYNRCNFHLGVKDETFILKRQLYGTVFPSQFMLISRYDSYNFFQKEQYLTMAFSDVVSNSFKGRYLLYTWDHGSIFGIFASTSTSNNFSKREDAFVVGDTLFELKRNKRINGVGDLIKSEKKYDAKSFQDTESFKISLQDEERDILTNDELSSVISTAFGEQRVSVLVMMNCYMQNIHTGYALHKVVDFLVAPEGMIDDTPGYNIGWFLSEISNNPQISSEDAAKTILDSINQFPLSIFSHNTGGIRHWAIFSIGLCNYPILVKLLDNLAEEMMSLIDQSEDNFANIYTVLTKLYHFDKGMASFSIGISNALIDIGCLLQFLQIKFPCNTKIANIWTDYSCFIDSNCVAKYIGKNIYGIPDTIQYERNPKPTGIGIYLPLVWEDTKSRVVNTYLLVSANRTQPSFFSVSVWEDLVMKILNHPYV